MADDWTRRTFVKAVGTAVAAGTEKHTFRSDVGGNARPLMEYLRDDDVQRTKGLILDAIQKG